MSTFASRAPKSTIRELYPEYQRDWRKVALPDRLDSNAKVIFGRHSIDRVALGLYYQLPLPLRMRLHLSRAKMLFGVSFMTLLKYFPLAVNPDLSLFIIPSENATLMGFGPWYKLAYRNETPEISVLADTFFTGCIPTAVVAFTLTHDNETYNFWSPVLPTHVAVKPNEQLFPNRTKYSTADKTEAIFRRLPVLGRDSDFNSSVFPRYSSELQAAFDHLSCAFTIYTFLRDELQALKESVVLSNTSVEGNQIKEREINEALLLFDMFEQPFFLQAYANKEICGKFLTYMDDYVDTDHVPKPYMSYHTMLRAQALSLMLGYYDSEPQCKLTPESTQERVNTYLRSSMEAYQFADEFLNKKQSDIYSEVLIVLSPDKIRVPQYPIAVEFLEFLTNKIKNMRGGTEEKILAWAAIDISQLFATYVDRYKPIAIPTTEFDTLPITLEFLLAKQMRRFISEIELFKIRDPQIQEMLLQQQKDKLKIYKKEAKDSKKAAIKDLKYRCREEDAVLRNYKKADIERAKTVRKSQQRTFEETYRQLYEKDREPGEYLELSLPLSASSSTTAQGFEINVASPEAATEVETELEEMSPTTTSMMSPTTTSTTSPTTTSTMAPTKPQTKTGLKPKGVAADITDPLFGKSIKSAYKKGAEGPPRLSSLTSTYEKNLARQMKKEQREQMIEKLRGAYTLPAPGTLSAQPIFTPNIGKMIENLRRTREELIKTRTALIGSTNLFQYNMFGGVVDAGLAAALDLPPQDLPPQDLPTQHLPTQHLPT